MVVVSAYYLTAYMRSGSDSDKFNLETSEESRLVLLGQEAPRPDKEQSPEVVIVSYRPPVEIPYDAGRTHAVLKASDLQGAPETVGYELASAYIDKKDDSSVRTFVVSADADTSEQIEQIDDVAVLTSSAISIDPEIFTSLYPGGNMNPRYWGDPHWAGNESFGGPTVPEGFVPVDSSNLAGNENKDARGLRMRIPAIGINADISELEIRDLGDSRAWSTPDKVVGHIPTTANPGEPRNGWYFGHLDNFISNEGDIFRRLPEIAEMINYDPVDVFIETEEAEYMYRVTGTRQMHRDELSITETNDAQIVLVTCWPFRVYDQRILVSASLIAVKPKT